MAIKFDLLRPDDLLNLTIEGENLRLDAADPSAPALVLEDRSQPGYLIVTFPPQTVVEEAFYESSSTKAPPEERSKPYNSNPPVGGLPAAPVNARISGPSRLVFRIPAGADTRIPFSTEGVLDWDPLEFTVSPLADVPPEPTALERQSAPSISEPARLETAIELPYRLHISPNHAVAWLHARGLRTRAGVTELWHTRLALRPDNDNTVELSRRQTAPLRAIWSPDYNRNRFKGDPPVFQANDPDMGVLTAMTPYDRHAIVVLTSAFRGFIRDLNDSRAYQPKPFFAEQLILSPLGGWLKSRGNWDPPVPYRSRFFTAPRIPGQQVFTAAIGDLLREVSLQPLPRELRSLRELPHDLIRSAPGTGEGTAGASVINRSSGAAGSLNPLALDRAGINLNLDLSGILWPPLTGETGDPLSLSEWTHIATLGRDHFVRIVYEGHLYPFGHRAALIKVTERKIRDVPHPQGGTTPLAYLVQRMFIVVRQPLRDFAEPNVKSRMLHGGRGLPFRNIRLTTLVTPDIAKPDGPSKIAGTIYSFWVRLGSGASDKDDFKFHALGEDISGKVVDMSASLIFIPLDETDAGRSNVLQKYKESVDARAVLVPGQKISYAPAAAGASNENTNLDTSALYFTTHTAPEGKEFGGFLPQLQMANVTLPAVEALLGQPAATRIGFHEKYLTNAAGNSTGLFAQIVKLADKGETAPGRLISTFTAEKGGGFATPDLSISGLTSKFGPMAGSLDNAASDIFSPADFFNEVKEAAMLFGTLSLADVLKPLTVTAGAPKLQFNKEALPVAPPAQKFKLTASLDWTPEVKDHTVGIVEFHAERKGNPAKFAVNGRFEQVVELPPAGPGAPPAGKMEGSLTDFRIELLNVVEVLFKRFAFSSEAGKKMDVIVELDSDTPVQFKEDLRFVEELRKTIPAGLFGDGPYLDINPARVKAGFSLGLPPVAVGVFALKDVVLAAYIELPFVSGKPLFDFGFSSRERPFLLTVAFLGGGGFFHIQIDTLGIKMLEAALEFGAAASVNLGVASGSVHIMAGIYFSMQRREIGGKQVDAATLEGYLRMGGELSVLGLISVSLEFYLSFRYESAPKSAAYGRATLTVKVEVLLFSTSVEITVEKRFGGSSGDPLFRETFTSALVWDEYAGAFA